MVSFNELTDWDAFYIGAPEWPQPNLPVFRKDFCLDKIVYQATIAICGLGNFALYVNGVWVNEGVIEPGWTDYKKSCLYSVYHIGSLLRNGENNITVLLGNGMYNVTGGRYVKFKHSFGKPMLVARCDIDYADGAKEKIVTDKSWLAAKGPITFSCVYGGEDFDGRVENWKKPTEACSDQWTSVILRDAPGGKLKLAVQPEVSVRRRLTPVSVHYLEPSHAVYDFGHNFAGRPVICVTGRKGQTVRMTPGELLNPDGTVKQDFTGGPHYYEYTLSGNKTECWMPYFTYYGFRYLETFGDAKIIEAGAAETFANAPVSGGFTCSDTLFNQIHTIILRAIESNMQSVFTDCPHREKLGWLEQMHLIGPGIIYNYDMRQMAVKILNDMSQAQLDNGLVPSIAPEYVVFDESMRDGAFRDSPEWGSACILLPWYVYESFGDISVLNSFYSMMKRYADYLLSKADNGILSYGLGDWMDVGHIGGVSKHTPMSVTASAILYYDLSIMEQIAALLGKKDDQAEYSILKSNCGKAYNEKLLNKDGGYASDSQVSNAMPLFLGIVPDHDRDTVLGHLVKDIRNRDNHFTGGDIGHPFIIRALAEQGRSDVVEDMFKNMDSPGYGFQIANGATTLCEDWDGPAVGRERCSQNHFMLGAAEEWFYRYLAGIRIRMDQKKVIFKPYIAKDVDWVNCWVNTPCGITDILWKKENGKVNITCNAPKELNAELFLPGSEQPIIFKKSITKSIKTMEAAK